MSSMDLSMARCSILSLSPLSIDTMTRSGGERLGMDGLVCERYQRRSSASLPRHLPCTDVHAMDTV